MATPQLTATIDAGAQPVRPAINSTKPMVKWPGWAQIVCTLGIFGAMILLSAWYGASAKPFSGQYVWTADLALLSVFFLLVGKWRIGQSLGVLINDRNVMSLSRLQMAAWTLVVVSGLFLLTIVKVFKGLPLSIELDKTLWAAMGISTASLVGSPLLLNQKKDQAPSDRSVTRTEVAVDDKQVNDNRQGTLYANGSASEALFSDMFEGDEVGNTAYVDMAKVQMFVFTALLVLSYAVSLWYLFGNVHNYLVNNNLASLRDVELPKLSENQVTLLLISHAGYLTSKSVSHTETDANASAAGAGN